MSWTVKRLPIGEVCTLVNGRAFKPNDWTETGTPIVRIQNLNDPTKPFNFYQGDVADRHIVNSGDILLSWSGTPGTSFGCFVWSRGRAILNQHIFKVHVHERIIDKNYFVYAVNGHLDEMIALAHGGVGLRHITKGKLESIEIPVPPLPEQHRIVTRIQELMSRADEIRRLREEALRASAAVAQAARFEAFQSDAPSVQLGELIQSGPTNGLYKPSTSYGAGTRILRINNFNAGDRFKGDAVLKRLALTDDEQRRFALSIGDFVINRVNGSLDVVGKACTIEHLEEPTVFESNMMRFAIDASRANRSYILHFLASPQCRDQIKLKAKLIQQASINQGDVQSFVVPLPPLNEQVEIAARLDQMAEGARQLRIGLSDGTDAMASLPAAIHRKAFAGEL